MSDRRFKLACRMLRNAGGPGFDHDRVLPGQKKGESAIDWLVRLGLAPDPKVAAEMLVLGRGLRQVLDDLEQDPEVLAVLDKPAN